KKTKRTVKTNLMMFLRPRIIRSPQDLASLTRDRYEHIRTEQIESLPDTRRMINDKLPRLHQRVWEDDGARNR
ncbi:MAG: hypothetical protein U9Q71_02940, partial [Pseudomonadota bacterium]|nr:hypothetical protein [Pseudomonadota bacterium]